MATITQAFQNPVRKVGKDAIYPEAKHAINVLWLVDGVDEQFQIGVVGIGNRLDRLMVLAPMARAVWQ